MKMEAVGIKDVGMKTATKNIYQSASLVDYEVTHFMRRIRDVPL
jgi:hypothetical protein